MRAELTIRQKESGLKSARAELEKSFGSKVREIAGTDTAGDLRRAKAEVVFLKQEAEEVAKRVRQKDSQIAELRKESAELRNALELAQSARQLWYTAEILWMLPSTRLPSFAKSSPAPV